MTTTLHCSARDLSEPRAHGVASWLLTKDHKRIGIMYLVVVTLAFILGGIFAAGDPRSSWPRPRAISWSSDTYNKLFTMHGIAMVFFVLIPAVPAILGNFVLPLMIGAKDVAFPKINLISWYVFVIGFLVHASARWSSAASTPAGPSTRPTARRPRTPT